MDRTTTMEHRCRPDHNDGASLWFRPGPGEACPSRSSLSPRWTCSSSTSRSLTSDRHERVTEMNVPKRAPAEPQGRAATEDVGAVEPADRCPVDPPPPAPTSPPP